MQNESYIKSIRGFNRFYTRQLGLLNEHLVASPFSLTEARVMYELAHRNDATASALGADLGIDAGQLSRILRDFEKRGLLIKIKSEDDARVTLLRLTEKGRTEFGALNRLSAAQIDDLLSKRSESEKERLVAAMNEIETILREEGRPDRSFILRPPHSGDYGWMIQKNGEIYAREYAWNEEYEGLVAKIVAEFISNFDPRLERCWIAEKDGENIGAVFVVKADEHVAKLRLLIVDPKARGLGVGKKLVSECTRFAREKGYKKITLWTNSVLTAARHTYEKEGYKLVRREPHHSFGHDLVGETWELAL